MIYDWIYSLVVILIFAVCLYIYITLHLHRTLARFRNKYTNCGVFFDA